MLKNKKLAKKEILLQSIGRDLTAINNTNQQLYHHLTNNEKTLESLCKDIAILEKNLTDLKAETLRKAFETKLAEKQRDRKKIIAAFNGIRSDIEHIGTIKVPSYYKELQQTTDPAIKDTLLTYLGKAHAILGNFALATLNTQLPTRALQDNIQSIFDTHYKKALDYFYKTNGSDGQHAGLSYATLCNAFETLALRNFDSYTPDDASLFLRDSVETVSKHAPIVMAKDLTSFYMKFALQQGAAEDAYNFFSNLRKRFDAEKESIPKQAKDLTHLHLIELGENTLKCAEYIAPHIYAKKPDLLPEYYLMLIERYNDLLAFQNEIEPTLTKGQPKNQESDVRKMLKSDLLSLEKSRERTIRDNNLNRVGRSYEAPAAIPLSNSKPLDPNAHKYPWNNGQTPYPQPWAKSRLVGNEQRRSFIKKNMAQNGST